jgi:hypothetical protein
VSKLGRRQPHQILLCLWCVIAGLVFVAGVAPTPGSIAALLPSWVLWIWYLLLTVGGIAGIVGAFWPRRRLYTGLQLERTSMIFLASGTAMYMIAMIGTAGARATGAAGFLAAWGAACVWRALQIHDDLMTIAKLHHDKDGR